MKDILCRLAQEVIRKTTETEVFIRIPKQQPYFLMFSYYHDEDASIFFNSTTKEQKNLYPMLKLGKSPLFKYYSKGSIHKHFGNRRNRSFRKSQGGSLFRIVKKSLP
ncbi:hypothetical protein [Leptospira mayottensis]|uniref:hypothetical protein n=1 Tax=Leptospira mayottensis TaxID=1137606 RepID=UPI003F54188C